MVRIALNPLRFHSILIEMLQYKYKPYFLMLGPVKVAKGHFPFLLHSLTSAWTSI